MMLQGRLKITRLSDAGNGKYRETQRPEKHRM